MANLSVRCPNGCQPCLRTKQLTGRSSTPRLLGSIIGVSGILGHPPQCAIAHKAGDETREIESHRHCERSEAIHLSVHEVTMDCFAALAMTVDIPSQSRGAFRPRYAGELPALLFRGRREDRVLVAPAVSRAICANKNAHEHTGQREHSGLPCAMALRLTSSSCVRKICQNVRTGGSDQPPVAGSEPVRAQRP